MAFCFFVNKIGHDYCSGAPNLLVLCCAVSTENQQVD